MPDHSATSPGEVSTDLMQDLVVMLATVLRLRSERIDVTQTFRSLGLDSLLTVEFVATVNARYGTAVKPDALFDHPTLLELARHVARERGLPGDAPFEEPVTHPAAPAMATASVPAPARAPVPAAGAVLDVLREELARILCCDPWDIDPGAPFNVLGVDSIVGAQFVSTINDIYGLHERAVTLYDHPDLAALAAHVVSATAAGTATRRPAPAVLPAPAALPEAAPRGGVMGLEALLDAVREDRISVDDALGLLRPGP
ncbi:acyl carrier protein [Streptomyces sp. NPDC017943]|uniref:acyl carrier protein n=1 Tax=Streptomyces sp. NPDC017943 TaxID=3365019 RepID=UPI0037BAFC8C